MKPLSIVPITVYASLAFANLASAQNFNSRRGSR